MIRCDENYFTEKYDLTRTHSDVVDAAKIVAPGQVRPFYAPALLQSVV